MAQEREKIYWDPENPWGHELVANALVEEGVEYIFTVTGGHTIGILNAAADKGIKVVTTRHEAAAVLAAMGYAVASPGKVGVACITAGMTPLAAQGILTATWGQVPVVVIGGACQTYGEGRRVLQEMDGAAFAKHSEAKDSIHCRDWFRIQEYMKWAFRHAQTGIPGCVYIDIPIDILYSRGDPSELAKYPTGRTEARPAGDPQYVKEAVKALAKAERPIIEVGSLARQSQAWDEVKEFVELTGIPVSICQGLLGDNPYNIGMQACPDADVALLLGKESQGMEGSLMALPYTEAKPIVVYPKAEDIGRCYPVDIGIVGDAKLVLRQMIDEAKGVKFPDFSEWVDTLKARREGAKAHLQELEKKFWDNKPIHPVRVTKEVFDWMMAHNLHKDAIMTMDGADTMVWWGRYTGAYGVPLQWPGQMASLGAIQRSLGSVGCGLPMGVGAACAHPDKFFLMPALGDGSLGEYMGELETLARLNVPGVIVCSNNSAWGMVYADQRRIWGRHNAPGAYFQEGLHYEKVAEGLGCAAGEFVEDPDEIRPALERAYERAKAESKPVFVNIMIDPNVYLFPWPWWLLPATPEGEPYEGDGM